MLVSLTLDIERILVMIASTRLPGLATDGQPTDDLTMKVNDTFIQLSDAAKQKLVALIRRHSIWVGALPDRPVIVMPPGSSSKAVQDGCEFCPSEGGGCPVCQNWESRGETDGPPHYLAFKS
jgi:hypothetical protein